MSAKNYQGIDLIRVVATFMVIAIHVTSKILYQYGTIPTAHWHFGNSIDGLCRTAVPLFLMMSGALLLDKKIELKVYFQKRFSRICYPFLFWSIIYIIYSLIEKYTNGVSLSLSEMGMYGFVQLLRGASFHLWYMYVLIGLYLFFPIISKWITESSNKEIEYYLVIWGIVTVFQSPFLEKYLPAIDFQYFIGFLGYPILGYYLLHRVPQKKRLFGLILFLLGTFITIFGTAFFTIRNGKFFDYFYNQLNINTIIASAGLFLYFRDIQLKNKWVSNTINFISKYSFGIYLSHIFVQKIAIVFGVNWDFVHPLVGIPLSIIVVFCGALALTFLIRKLPLGDRISG